MFYAPLGLRFQPSAAMFSSQSMPKRMAPSFRFAKHFVHLISINRFGVNSFPMYLTSGLPPQNGQGNNSFTLISNGAWSVIGISDPCAYTVNDLANIKLSRELFASRLELVVRRRPNVTQSNKNAHRNTKRPPLPICQIVTRKGLKGRTTPQCP